jgi:hypothetical protein
LNIRQIDTPQVSARYAKGVRNLLCDAGTANVGIAAFELYDRVDEVLRWSFWTGAPMV